LICKHDVDASGEFYEVHSESSSGAEDGDSEKFQPTARSVRKRSGNHSRLLKITLQIDRAGVASFVNYANRWRK
jgi:hypothetical protein